MDIRRPKKKYQNDPSGPGTGLGGQHLQSNQQNQTPDFRHDTQEEPNIEPLRDPSPEEQVGDEDRVRRDSQEIRLEGLEPERLELQRDVARRRRVGDQPRQTQQIDDPHVVVAERLPEHLGGDGLSVMHAAFAGVVAQDSVHEDLFLVLVEPPVLSAKAAFRLCRGRRHPECGDDADNSCNEAFEGEEVAPAAFAVAVADVEEAEGEECAYDGGGFVRDPEVAQADGQLLGLVPEGEEEDRVGNAMGGVKSQSYGTGGLELNVQSALE